MGRRLTRIGVLGELDPRLAPRDAATNLGVEITTLAAPAFVPVEVVDTSAGGLSLISPDGYRVEGLAAADVAEILRRLR
jgi:hypothetical protein